MESNFLEKDYSKINKKCLAYYASQTDNIDHAVVFYQAWNIHDLEGHGPFKKNIANLRSEECYNRDPRILKMPETLHI